MIPLLVAIRWLRHVTYLLLRGLASVTNPALDIMEIAVLQVICHPGCKDWIAMPDLPIGTVGIKMLNLPLVPEKVLHNMLQNVLQDHPIMLPLSVPLFGGHLSHLYWDWQQSN